MRKLTYFILAVLCITTVTSCLSDPETDDKAVTSKEEAKMLYQKCEGIFNGYTYTSLGKTSNNDTISSTVCAVKDSMIIINNIPDSLIAKCIKGDAAKALKKSTGTSNLSADIQLFYYADASKKDFHIYTYGGYINGIKNGIDINYDNEKHNLSIPCNVHCYYDPYKNAIQVQIAPVGVTVDKIKGEYSENPTGVNILFYSTAKK